MTEQEQRGKRIYDTVCTWFGLDVGQTANLIVTKPDGRGITLSDDGNVFLSQADYVAVRAYHRVLQYPETHTIGGTPREEINVGERPADAPGPWRGEERL